MCRPRVKNGRKHREMGLRSRCASSHKAHMSAPIKQLYVQIENVHTHTHARVEHAVMAFASQCLPMVYQMRFTCPVGKAWEQHVSDASQPNYLWFRHETGGQISDGMDVNFQHERIKCCPQLNKTHKRKKRDLASAQEGLCAPFLPCSLLYLSSCSLHSPGGLWWKNVKWSRFCEHHLAACALIAPITSLTFLPAYYTTVVHLTLCSAGGKSIRATHNGSSFYLTMRTLQPLTTTKANVH